MDISPSDKNALSTNRLVVFLLFICAALMTSVFIVHARHEETPMLSADQGLIFPASRDLNPFQLVSGDSRPFTQKNFLGHWTLLFFGFTHCASICPTTLGMLSQAYPGLLTQWPNLQVALISLDPSRDSPEALNEYTHTFDPRFLGVSGKLQEIRRLQSQLGIFSAVDQSNQTGNYQLQHTASILLINPHGQWVGILKNDMSPKQFASALTKAIRLLDKR